MSNGWKGTPYKSRPFNGAGKKWWRVFGPTWRKAWKRIDEIQYGNRAWRVCNYYKIRRFFGSYGYFYEIPEYMQWTLGWLACLHYVQTEKRRPFKESLAWAAEVERNP